MNLLCPHDTASSQQNFSFLGWTFLVTLIFSDIIEILVSFSKLAFLLRMIPLLKVHRSTAHSSSTVTWLALLMEGSKQMPACSQKNKPNPETNFVHDRDAFVQAFFLKFCSLLLLHLVLTTLVWFREEDYQTVQGSVFVSRFSNLHVGWTWAMPHFPYLQNFCPAHPTWLIQDSNENTNDKAAYKSCMLLIIVRNCPFLIIFHLFWVPLFTKWKLKYRTIWGSIDYLLKCPDTQQTSDKWLRYSLDEWINKWGYFELTV